MGKTPQSVISNGGAASLGLRERRNCIVVVNFKSDVEEFKAFVCFVVFCLFVDIQGLEKSKQRVFGGVLVHDDHQPGRSFFKGEKGTWQLAAGRDSQDHLVFSCPGLHRSSVPYSRYQPRDVCSKPPT